MPLPFGRGVAVTSTSTVPLSGAGSGTPSQLNTSTPDTIAWLVRVARWVVADSECSCKEEQSETLSRQSGNPAMQWHRADTRTVSRLS
jgi:hypothetical protein